VNKPISSDFFLSLYDSKHMHMHLVKRRSFRISQRNDISKESFNHLPLGKITFRNIKIFVHHCVQSPYKFLQKEFIVLRTRLKNIGAIWWQL